MPPGIATLLFAIGIAGLFWLDRGRSVRVSKFLWLPVIWVWVIGSRPVSVWLGVAPMKEIPGQLPSPSLLDQLFAGALLISGAIVLIHRRRDVSGLLKASWPLVLYFSFCLLSLVWSDFPAWGFKRWVRGLGDLIMVVIVATEAQPTAALGRLFSRVGFVLLPASVLLNRYYPDLAVSFDPWGEGRVYTGVTSSKNILGNLVFLVGLGALWQALSLVRDRKAPNRARRLLAQCTLLAFGINLLIKADSATSLACFVLGAGLMLATSLPLFRRNPAAVHALVLIILLGGAFTELLGGRAAVTEALGRKSNLTGRIEIWRIVIPMVHNWVGGTGFETFWAGPRVAKIFALVGGYSQTNEAHNGYIEVYLNLGLLGVGLIALILGQGYRRTVSVFRRDSTLGTLLVAYVVTAVTYNITEAGFRILSLEWFFLLLSVVAANRAACIPKRTRRSYPSLGEATWQSELPIPVASG